MGKQYIVVKDIPNGWETSAQIGDILTFSWWDGAPTLMKGNKAVCDLDSEYGKENCKIIDEGPKGTETNE